MKVLVLGGTGFIGRSIAEEFSNAGHSVTLFSRGLLKAKELSKFPHFSGDRRKVVDLKKVAAQDTWDLIVDNLAYNGNDVEILLKAFPSSPRLFLTSTISVYRYARPGTNQPLQEKSVVFDSTPKEENLDDIHWSYARGKWDAERTLRTATPEPRWTIFRPTMVYGPGDPKDRGFWYFARLLDGRPILLADGGQITFRLAFPKEIAAAYLAASQTNTSIGKTYNLANPSIFSLREFLVESADAMKTRPQFVSVPAEWMSDWKGPLGLDHAWIPDLTEVEKDLRIPFLSAREMIHSTASWFKENWKGDLRKIKITREDEIKFIEQWKQAAKIFKST